MAPALPQFSPLWRSSLRIWLASTLTIGILLWSGRSQVLGVGLVMAVMFVNENNLAPVRNISQQAAGAVIGILTAFVLHELSTEWVVLGVALLLTGLLIRLLGLLPGLSTGYMGCWALDLMHRGNQVNWAVIFNLALAAVVGILMAQLATWALWPHRPQQQLPALEASISSRFSAQITALETWLSNGGTPPPPLRSQDLLPRIRQLQLLRDQNRDRAIPAPTARLFCRWAQMGSLWQQLLRQWLLLEPLLRQLPAPLPAQGPDPLLLSSLGQLAQHLQSPAAPWPQAGASLDALIWLEHASDLGAPKPLLLAIGQQCQTLQRLAAGRALVKAAIDRSAAAAMATR